MKNEFNIRADGSIVADVGNPTRVVVPPDGPRRPNEDPHDDGYPDIIIDQPRGYQGFNKIAGVTGAPTVEDVWRYWERFLERQSPPRRGQLGEVPVTPRIEHSRWIADCTCGGGMLCWPSNPYTACLDCGRLYEVQWQPPAERSAVIRVLAIRPVPNRNWDPTRTTEHGEQIETVEFLMRENLLMHGQEM